MAARDETGRRSTEAPALPAGQFLRWCWRQLTSMRTALLLLLLLALAAIPGSFIPQTKVDANAVFLFATRHPDLTPVLNRLGLFAVYSSPAFSAIYLLLMVSLVGCIIPRTFVYARALKARPPKAPRNLDRLPASASFTTEEDATAVLQRAARTLRDQRYRVDVDGPGSSGPVEHPAEHLGVVRAEKGYLREAGNLVFHVSLVVALVGIAIGALWGYKGTVIVVEGEGFANTPTQYDDFSAGARFSPGDLPAFALHLDSLTARFQTDGPQRGAPRLFEATGSYVARPGAATAPFDITVNHPLDVDGSSVYLVGQGYAPEVTVRDGKGDVVFSGAVPFLPEDASYTSSGVVKVPDAQPAQLGFEGFFLPTLAVNPQGVPVSAFPGAARPALLFFAYTGDLGLNSGAPQSVYSLDKAGLTQVRHKDGTPVRGLLLEGQTFQLPGGAGSITYDRTRQFARFQISHSPLKLVPLGAAATGVLGLIASLFLRPRRAWVRARSEGGRTVVEVARLDRVSGADLGSDVSDLVHAVKGTSAT